MEAASSCELLEESELFVNWLNSMAATKASGYARRVGKVAGQIERSWRLDILRPGVKQPTLSEYSSDGSGCVVSDAERYLSNVRTNKKLAKCLGWPEAKLDVFTETGCTTAVEWKCAERAVLDKPQDPLEATLWEVVQ